MKAIIKIFLRALFELGQSLGFDVLPRNFYSEIPDIRYLKKTKKWLQPYSMAGIEGAEVMGQFEFVKDCCNGKFELLKEKKAHIAARSLAGHDGYGCAESDFLYAFILKHKPKKIIQIGCGVATAVVLEAYKDSSAAVDITCVEPFPDDFLKGLAKEEKITLVEARGEDVPKEFYLCLKTGDFLFVDSTHTLCPGAEVPRIVLEVLPRLEQGVYVHFHDIYFPYDYATGILDKDLFFPHESVFLQAFLTNNSQYRIAACLSMLHYADPQRLGTFLPNYKPEKNNFGLSVSKGHFPSAIYLYKHQ